MTSPDVIDLVIDGALAWILTALCCYLFLRRTIYNALDPLVIVNVAIPFSAALLVVLCVTDLVTWDKLSLFTLVLLAYLVGGRVAAAFFGRGSFREIVRHSLADIREDQVIAVLIVTVLVTMAVAALGLATGAEGDARLAFGRVFRPILLLQNGLFLISLLLLLAPSVPTPRAWLWLVLLVALSVPFSGKSVLVPVVYWVGFRLYLQRRRIRLRTIFWSVLAIAVGVTVMGILAYSTSSPGAAFLLFTNRLWMSGDVYIFAYQREGLASVHANYPVSFTAYVLHPLTSLVGIRGYEKPLGSMLASEVMRDDVLTGPNPQLPVVLDYFFSEDYGAILPLALVTGLLVIGVRPLGMFIARSVRSRYLRIGAIVAAIFAPPAGFLDTSLVAIALVGIMGATALLVALELVWPRRLASVPTEHTFPASPPHTLPTSTS
ncbi:MAG TPA: hypothetical protein VHB68_17545 [Steroidobacteraceae bacterium]|nr:hypothetical protein [Steroidobacteraceae bacterium]